MKKVTILFMILASLCLRADQWNGTHYNHYSDNQFNGAVALLSEKIDLQYYNHQDACILDLGCGSGRVTRYIAERVPLATVIGKDISESMISEAQHNNSDLAPQLTFIVEPAQALQETNQYDLIVCGAAIHWMDDHTTVFNNILRALKPGGLLIVAGAAKNKNHAIIQAFEEVCSWKKWAHLDAADAYAQYNPMNLSTIKEQLSNAGLSIIEITSFEKSIPFATQEAFKNWFLGWAGGFKIIDTLNKVDRETLQQDMLDVFFSKAPHDETGNIIYTITRGLVIAKKSPNS